MKGPGDVLLGQFVIERTWTASAIIHQVRDRERKGARFVAKCLQPGGERHQWIVDWFLREGEIWRAVTGHSNLVSMIHPMRQDATDGAIYHFIEYIDGANLEEIVRSTSEGRLAWPQAVHWARQIADAMDYTTRRERNGHGTFVHRDLEPSNILVTRDGIPKVSDWGIARDLERPEEPIPVFSIHDLGGPAIGKPRWMPPEQFPPARGEGYGVAGDVYGFGGTLLYMLTGAKPNPPEVSELRNISGGPGDIDRLLGAWRAEALGPELAAVEPPAALARLVLDCLEPDQARRPKSFSEILESLQEVGRGGHDWGGVRCRHCKTRSNREQQTCPVCEGDPSSWEKATTRPRSERSVRCSLHGPGTGGKERRPFSIRRGWAALFLGVMLLAGYSAGERLWFSGPTEAGAGPPTAVPPTVLDGVRVPPGCVVEQARPLGPNERSQPAGPARSAGWAWKVRHEATGIVFVLVEPGQFMMGAADGEFQQPLSSDDMKRKASEEPRHAVKLTKAFYIAMTETTRSQWRSGLEARPEHFDWLRGERPEILEFLVDTSEPGSPSEPVGSVRWVEATDFCKAFGMRLPTEAEWEYACRAGTDTAYSFGDDSAVLDQFGWHSTSFITGSPSKRPQPVMGKEPNPWGLYDMHGNLWEWCEDAADDERWPYPSAPWEDPVLDPVSKSPDTWAGERVKRGGGFELGHHYVRSASRSRYNSHRQTSSIGFRAVLSIE